MPGQILGDRYQVERQLNKQAGRWTLLANDLQTHQPVLLRLLFIDDDLSPTDLRLFKREVEVLKLLTHPCTPAYLGYFEIDLPRDGHALVLIQSYVDGMPLSDYIQQVGLLTEAQVICVAASVLNTLSYLHDLSPPIIHRDIRPRNLLLSGGPITGSTVVHLTNFGSIKSLSTDSTALTRVGVDGYVPPELLGGRALTVSDLYSLGASLIEGLTGLHPTELQKGGMRIHFETVANLSPDLAKWLKRMVSPSLDYRWKSAQEALGQLPQVSSAA